MVFLLDTNVCIGAMRGVANVVAQLTAQAPGDCAVSTITAYELHLGIQKCARPAAESAKLARTLARFRVLPFDETAAQEAAEIRAVLERSGKIIGPYDLLIAGHARVLGLTLVTGNVAEFSRVPRLQIQDWTKA